MIDVSGFIMNTDTKAFKNNNSYSGVLTISGTWVSGYNSRTVTIPIGVPLDMVTVLFSGHHDSGTPPDAAWFGRGTVDIYGNNVPAGYTSYPTNWGLTARVSGTDVIITAWSVSQIAPTLTLVSADVSIKIIDYSVF